MKNTVITFGEMKKRGEKISMLTAYDYSTAKIVDAAGINSILVGDSLGNVILGYENSTRVTMEDMIHHTRAVSRGVKNALLISDMPFMSYQQSVYDAVVNAGRLVQEGCANAVKLEGGVDMADKIEAIVKASIPVCAHIGLTPQSTNAFGGFKIQGKTSKAAQKIIDDAKAIEAAGAFAVVIEGVPAPIAEMITRTLTIPTIGIGAGNVCDGQVLVVNDMLGMYDDFVPKFVKRYASVGESMTEAFKKYDEEVKNGTFPDEAHSYKMNEEELSALKSEVE
jgi:3-methyl-2-oxobutanoate hydroxymethyltransferase